MRYLSTYGVVKKDINKLGIIGATLAYLVALTMSVVGGAKAAPPPFSLQPFEFVGTVENCGVAGVDTVTAEWDSSTGNPSPSILLEKLGATANCAAAGVDIITSLEGGPISALTELNFEYEDGGHCGAGAPRFNVQVDGTTYFLGCSGGVHTPTSDPDWIHVEFGLAEFAAAGIPETGTLEDVYIIFDEGEDTPSGGTIGTSGTVNIDNISVNGQVVGSPTSPLDKDACKKGGWMNLTDDEGNAFKNQGDCVSFVATGGKNKAGV